jgi:hypothetical protein
MRSLSVAVLLVTLPLRLGGERQAQIAEHEVGGVDFRISCAPAAQATFNRGVALLHHMTYPQARGAFEEAAKIDPQCAMAHWGIAMTLFQPLWPTRPSPEALRRGWDATQRAKALAPGTERERLFIAAVEAFYLEPSGTDYWLRVNRWELAMRKAFDAFPEDAETATFYALAHLATSPSNSVTSTHSRRAADILTRVYDRHPGHPGAMHYLVHANDGPGRERERLDVTRKYESNAPRNPHALHMPTHIYTRLGDWDGVIRGNLLAAEAALAHPAGERGELVWDEFPHAIEYLVYAYLQQGADAAAAAQIQRLRSTERLEPTFKTAFHLASTQARFALERHAWPDAAAIPTREPSTLDWDRFAWPEAIVEFARGLGAVRMGRAADAAPVVARLERLETAMANAGEDLFARNIRVLRLELAAWIADREGRRDEGVRLMRQATDLEAETPKHAVTPGPTLPATELLGDLLLEHDAGADSRRAYETSLKLYPNRFNSLLGAARASHAAGDDAAARNYYRRLLDLAGASNREAVVVEARRFVGR